MSFDPVLPWAWIGVILAVCLVVFGLLLAQGSKGFRPWPRRMLAASYLAAICGMVLILANPGRMETLSLESRPVWIVALDLSSSMNAPMLSSGEGGSRMASAGKDLKAMEHLVPEGAEVRWVSIKDRCSIHPDAGTLLGHEADGKSSRLALSLTELLAAERMEGCIPAGIILLSDGRDTEPGYLSGLAREAGNMGVPVHTICYGEQWEEPRLAMDVTKSMIHAFPGNVVQVGAHLKNRKLGSVQTAVSLLDVQGKTLAKKVVNVENNADTTVDFTFTCPSENATFSLKCDAVAGDSSGPDGHSSLFSVQVMKSRIRVFMAEGAPYWDSKFLAQLLRRQPAFDVRSIHMLTPERFFRINTGEENSMEEDEESIPSSLDEFLRFDMVILGKGAERIITPARAAALQAFVRDFGGLLVFARGKSYGGRFAEMEMLEPFVWKAPAAGEHQLTPSPEGMKDGLFGVILPGRESSIWSSLPPLEDVWEVNKIHPGTRIVARSPDGRLPLLAVKKLGLGATGMINGDGLWKWDFFPDAVRLGNWYEVFWGQFLPWIQTAAEFRPGYDLSLHVERASVPPATPLAFTLGWRGKSRPAGLSVELVDIRTPDQVILTASALSDSVKSGIPRWNGVVTSPGPGRYILRARMAGNTALPMPDVCIDVPAPPGENDNLNADPSHLAAMSELTGGLRLPREDLSGKLPGMMEPAADATRQEEAFFPLWNRWYMLLGLSVLPALFWWMRRRNGLL